MSWIELTLHTTHESLDWVRTLLATTTYEGSLIVTPYSELETQAFLLEEIPARATSDPVPWNWTVRWCLPNHGGGRSQLAEMEQRLSGLHRTHLTSDIQTALVDTLPDPAMASQACQRVAERFVLTFTATPPATDQPRGTVNPSDINLYLSPSLSFGSGLHPATRLCLTLIDRYLQPGMRALDLGCGSGILSLAMAKLGAEVVALDNDPIAVTATQTAAYHNQLAERVTAQIGSLGEGSTLGHWMGGSVPPDVAPLQAQGEFDLIVANILARVHGAIAPAYRQALRHQTNQTGLLITSGFTADVEANIQKDLTQAGLEPLDRERYDEWVALVHRTC
jgi:ribosomal protein L11 methyltransferase